MRSRRPKRDRDVTEAWENIDLRAEVAATTWRERERGRRPRGGWHAKVEGCLHIYSLLPRFSRKMKENQEY